MVAVVPPEVATIAGKYNFTWTDRTFQQDIASLARYIKETHMTREYRFKEGVLNMQVRHWLRYYGTCSFAEMIDPHAHLTRS